MTLQHSYGTNGISDAFAFSFPIDQDADIQVLIDNVEQTSGFTVHGAASPGGGVVVFLAAPSAGKTLLIRHRGRSAVSSEDASSGYLSDKLVAGAGISLTAQEDGEGHQVLVVANSDVSTDLYLKKSPSAEEVEAFLDAYDVATNTLDNVAPAVGRGNLNAQEANDKLTWISNSLTEAGKALLDDVSATAQRATLGLGTAAQADLGTASGQVLTADKGLLKLSNLSDVNNADDARNNIFAQKADTKLTWISNSLTEAGKALLDDASAADQRATLGLGTAALANVGTGPDELLTAGKGLLKLSNLSDVDNIDNARNNILAQKADAKLTWITDSLTEAGKALLDDASAAAQRSTLGLNDVAYLNVAQDWTQPQRNQARFVSSVGGSVVLDMASYQNFELELSADVSFADPAIAPAMVGQRGSIGIVPNGFSITAMGDMWKRVGDTGAPGEITGPGRIDYHIRAIDRIEYAYNDVEA